MGCAHSGVANVKTNKAKVTPQSILKNGEEDSEKKVDHPVGLVQKNPNSPTKKLKFADDLKKMQAKDEDKKDDDSS